MNKSILSPATVTERNSQPTCRSGYAAPRMFAVGNTVELIQGFYHYGRHDYDGTFSKGY
jgi:hypothetical protein